MKTNCISRAHRTPVRATHLADYRPNFGARSVHADDVPFCDQCVQILSGHLTNLRPMTAALKLV
jgi:hypothetical protein